ncbi:unnamed protein product [Rangifer tarandus platyrhynchus]|uniref:Uncharacterized protein n=1 Tax=Rangifer tarandus platyrhynchus TaxID=3082113 RepID=A0ABN9A4Y4_RANTA|nr:unnamed protein product [Rangifer tarandus platyrhynchus]
MENKILVWKEEWPIQPRAPAKLNRGGGWVETGRGRSGGVRVERSPAPRSGPGFACHPLARSAAENSIITAGESGDWERKIRDPATLGSACAPAALHPKHTHIFPPDLESHPKPPQVQVRDSALPPPRPPDPLSSAALPGCFPASPPVRVQSPTPGAAACSRERASERAIERASQPASLRAAAATQLRPCGRQGARRAGTRAQGMPSARFRGRRGLLLLGVTYSN